MNCNFSFRENLPVLLLCCSSSLYIFQFFPAPFYFFFLTSLFLIFFPCYSKNFQLSYFDWLIFIGILISMFVFRLLDSDYSVMSYYVIGFVCFYTIIALLSTKSLNEKVTCGYIALGSSTLVMVMDACFRFLTPNTDYIKAITSQGNESLFFYAYKHSFVFQDSNFSGLLSVMLVCLSLCLWQKTNNKYALFFLLVNVFLVCFSLSRAAIFGMFFFFSMSLIYFLYITCGRLLILSLIMFFCVLLLSFVAVFFAPFDMTFVDGSLLTKFALFEEVYAVIVNFSILELFYGWGFNRSMEHMDLAAHNIIVTILLETGLIGLFFFSVFIIRNLTKNVWCSFSFLTFILISMSFGLIISAYMVPLALIVTISEKDKGRF